MYLSRLEIHGFKSFANRTVVDFSPGVTVVVGPNGCGKSNVVDAVRWVIGEQRARILRSEKMENIIFNGTSGRRSLGMAEVLLTVENRSGILPVEYSEVTIGRRLFRSGESEYLLNGVQCRLKDITDLFMDTGMGAGAYSVIELKMIEDILSDNAQDRRHMFEEAAGITKYKIRRAQTLRKLGNTQVDLNRVRDLVEELDKRVRSLHRQAQKAARYRKLQERLNHLAIAISYVEYERLKDEDESLAQALLRLKETLEGRTAALTVAEARHEALQKDHIEKEQTVVSAQMDLSNHLEMLRSAESDLRLNRERRDVFERDLKRADSDETEEKQRRIALQAQLEHVAEELEEAVPAGDEAARNLEAARLTRSEADEAVRELRTSVQSLTEKERESRDELNERSRRLDKLTSRLEVLGQDSAESQSHFEEIQRSVNELDARFDTLATALDDRKRMEAEASSLLDRARADRNTLLETREEIEIRLRNTERQYDAVTAETTLLQSLLASYEEFSEPIQYLAGTEGWSSERLRTVADILSCDKEYRPAVEAALGSWSSCVVVRSTEEAEAAVGRLRQENKGRATFLILDRLESVSFPEPVRINGARPLADLLRTDSAEFDAVIRLLFHDSYFAEDLESIRSPIPDYTRLFNPQGDWVQGSALRHGGSGTTETSPVSSRVSRREQLEQAEQSRRTILTSLTAIREELDALDAQVEAVDLTPLEEKLSTAFQVRSDAEKAHSRTAYEREILGRRLDEIASRRSMLEASRSAAEQEAEGIESGLDGLMQESVALADQRVEEEKALVIVESRTREAFSLFNDANIQAVQTRNRVDNLTRDRDRIVTEIANLDADQQRRRMRVQSMKTQRDEATAHAESLETEIRRMMDRRGELEHEVNTTREVLMSVKVDISDLEGQLRVLRREREQSMTEESGLSVRKAEISTRIFDLVATIREEFEIDLRTHTMEIDEDMVSGDVRAEIQELRSKIKSLGPVNAIALESFEEEKERLDFLRAQLSDLESAENTLRKTIEEINTTASERFDSTFQQIRQNFSTLFTELFGETATADLILQEPDNPLESTIEILAKPTGKKPSVLAQLSGGEKTLTAIALLFSIYLVKPSPFCILDEVDAPLDDANISRFMHLIRSFSETTQFILVTHNKQTMEAADRLYGITMQEQGISRLVGVKFDEELQMVA